MDKVIKLATHSGKKMNAKEVRAMLLSGCEPIIRKLLTEATGTWSDEYQTYLNYDKKSREMVLNAIVPMMQQAGDLQKLNAASIADILQLLREGIVTVAEAKELMSIASMKFEIEELSSLAAKLDETQKAA